MADILYEIGETNETRAFWQRNVEFEPLFDTLIALTDRCFGREHGPTNRAEEVVFDLGQACRDDFGEVVMQAVHGQGNGAIKLLRGLYERALTAAYLIKNPDKAERFVRYGAVQEHRIMMAALETVSEQEFDEAMGSGNTVAEIKQRYDAVKSESETVVCSKCGKTRTSGSWDPLDIASMARKVGEPFLHLYPSAYALPNLQVHATLSSIGRKKFPRDEADFAFKVAFGLMFTILEYQNLMYKLDMDRDLVDFGRVFRCTLDASDASVITARAPTR